jgi:chemotaxis-related protein WspD
MRGGLDRCWNQVGVGGDASCPRLAEVGHCRNCEEYARAGRGLLDREASAALREDWSRLLAEAKPSVTLHGESAIVFQVGEEYLALSTRLLERVVEMRTVHTVPSRTGAIFLGLVNVDGELVPCFSAAVALQVEEDKSQASPGRLLILRDRESRLACAVGQVIGVLRLSPEDLEPPPVTLARNQRAFTTSVFSVKGKHAGLLDGPKFLQRLLSSANA